MKDKNLKKLLLLTLATSASSLLCRVLLTLFSLDSRYGVYEHGTVFPTIYHILLALCCAAACALGIAYSTEHKAPASPKAGRLSLFASYITGFLIAANTLLSIYYIVLGYSPSGLEILEIIFAIPAVIFLLGFSDSPKKPTAMAFFSLFVIGWLAVQMIFVYFDTSTLNTSPNKTMHELALLAGMSCFLNEPRFLLGKSSGKLFLGTAPVAVILLVTSSIPNLLFPGLLSIGLTDNFLVYAVELTLALFIISRMHSYACDPKDQIDESLSQSSESLSEKSE